METSNVNALNALRGELSFGSPISESNSPIIGSVMLSSANYRSMNHRLVLEPGNNDGVDLQHRLCRLKIPLRPFFKVLFDYEKRLV